MTPLRSDQNTVKIKYGYSRADEVYLEEEVKLDKSGLAKLQMHPPIDSTNATALRIEVCLLVWNNFSGWTCYDFQ